MSAPYPPPPAGFSVIPPPPTGFSVVGGNAPDTHTIEQRRADAKAKFEENSPPWYQRLFAGTVNNPQNTKSIQELARIGTILNDTAPGAATGMESTGNKVLDFTRGVMAGGVLGGAETAGMGLAEGLKNAPAVQGVKNVFTAIKSKSTAEDLIQQAAKLKASLAEAPPDANIPLTTTQAVKEAAKQAIRPIRKARLAIVDSALDALPEANQPSSSLPQRLSELAQERPAPPQAQVAVPQPQVPSFIENQLNATRGIETPAQQAERMRAIADAQATERVPLGESEKLNIPRPAPQEIPPQGAPINPSAMIERGIAPSGMKAKLSTMRIASKLPDVAPEIVGVSPGPQFDAKLMEAFKRTTATVNAAEEAIPESATVAKAPVVDQFKEMAKSYEERGLEQSASKLTKLAEKWNELPEQIPWDTFKGMKRAFFKEGGLNAAPLRRAYGVLMDAASPLSTDLAEANQAYSTVRRALEAGNIDLQTGRRIKSVGVAAKFGFGSTQP